jgi:hypothetical protein
MRIKKNITNEIRNEFARIANFGGEARIKVTPRVFVTIMRSIKRPLFDIEICIFKTYKSLPCRLMYAYYVDTPSEALVVLKNYNSKTGHATTDTVLR